MFRSSLPELGRLLAPLALALFLPLDGLADVVKTKDDRTFEGTILARDASGLTIDTVIGDIRTQLILPADDVASVEERAVPAGFFDPPPPDPRLSQNKGTLYLVVPIKGRFGEDIYASAAARLR